jgi:hypothetical protein
MREFSLWLGNALDVLRTLPDESVHACATSPPLLGSESLWNRTADLGRHSAALIGLIMNCGTAAGVSAASRGLAGRFHPALEESGQGPGAGGGRFCRRCGAGRGELGLEPTPELYISHVASIFAQVRRVLRTDGTLWLVLGELIRRIMGQSGSQDNARHPAANSWTYDPKTRPLSEARESRGFAGE